jgi:hypothetical protein
VTTWARLKIWIAGEVLTAADLNAEFNRGVTSFNDAFNTSTGHQHTGSDSATISYLNLSDKPTDTNTFVFPVTGTLVVAADSTAVWHRIPETGTVQEVQAVVKTAPTGANIILDVETSPDGAVWTSIWLTANRLNIGTGVKLANTLQIDTPALTKGNLMRLAVDQIGSTIAGADLTVNVIYTATL